MRVQQPLERQATAWDDKSHWKLSMIIRNKLRPDPDKGKPEIDRKSLVSLRGMIAFRWNFRKF